MAFLIAPGCDLDSAIDVRVGIDDSGSFQRIDDPSGPSSQPA